MVMVGGSDVLELIPRLHQLQTAQARANEGRREKLDSKAVLHAPEPDMMV